MKRLSLFLALSLLAALVVVVAPALSARSYVPDPVDFEMAAPAAPGGLHKAATGPVQSPVLKAPKRFNVVGLRWASGAEPRIHIRARESGGGWSPWRELASGSDHSPDLRTGEQSVRGYSDAAWAGDADYVQYRLSRPVPGLRLHFVNTLGTATAADRFVTSLRRVANSGIVTAAALFDSEASAAASQPRIVSRAAWGAKNCVPRSGPEYGSVKMAFVHHTVTLNDYTAEESPSIVLGICRFHRNSNGWNDVGYNFLVDKYGTIFEGRAGGVDKPVLGAQAQGFNAQSTGIANLGDYSSVPQSSAALSAMAALIRWKLPVEGVPTGGTVRVSSAGGNTNRYPAGTVVTMKRISGHRDANNTECPGSALYAQLPELRRLVGDVPPATDDPAPVKSSTRFQLSATPAVLEVPQASRVGGVLATTAGDPVTGARVKVQALRGRKWRTVATPKTAGDGGFGATVAPTAKQQLRAVYAGASAFRATTSKRVVVSVRPDVTLKSPSSRVSVRSPLRLRGGVRPAKGLVTVLLERRAGKRYVRVSNSKVKPARGRFGLTVRPSLAGLYRARARFGGDAANLSGVSPRVHFRVVGKGGGTASPGSGSGGTGR
jgi:hypothetical protein